MSRVIVKQSSPKPRVIVKAPTMMVDSSGKPMFMYGGAGGGTPAQRTRASKVLGGIGQVAGAGLAAATGRHRDLMGLISGMQGGSAVGRQVGDWAGRATKLIPGSESRMARRTLDEKARQAYRGQLAERDRDITKPSLTLRERMGAAPLLGLRGRSSQNVIDNRLRQWAKEAAAPPQGAAAATALREDLNQRMRNAIMSQHVRAQLHPDREQREADMALGRGFRERAPLVQQQTGMSAADLARNMRVVAGGSGTPMSRGGRPPQAPLMPNTMPLRRPQGFELANEEVPDPNAPFADHERTATLPDAPGIMNPPSLETGDITELQRRMEAQGLDPELFQ